MQAITKIMPLFFGLITYGLNAATTMYFVVSNAWRIGQQHFVLNKMYEEDATSAAKNQPTHGRMPTRRPRSKTTVAARRRNADEAETDEAETRGRPGRAATGAAPTTAARNQSMSGAARRKRKRKR